MAQIPRTPDLKAQRVAMEKLAFLAGRWAGDANIYRGDAAVQLDQTEEARYKLDGLILLIEGVGRKKPVGEAVLQAFGFISYDDEAGTYRLRTFNDGRFLETEVALLAEGQGLRWGFALGEVKTKSVLRISDQSEWTEVHEIAIGEQPARKLMEVTVRRYL